MNEAPACSLCFSTVWSCVVGSWVVDRFMLEDDVDVVMTWSAISRVMIDDETVVPCVVLVQCA